MPRLPFAVRPYLPPGTCLDCAAPSCRCPCSSRLLATGLLTLVALARAKHTIGTIDYSTYRAWMACIVGRAAATCQTPVHALVVHALRESH